MNFLQDRQKDALIQSHNCKQQTRVRYLIGAERWKTAFARFRLFSLINRKSEPHCYFKAKPHEFILSKKTRCSLTISTIQFTQSMIQLCVICNWKCSLNDGFYLVWWRRATGQISKQIMRKTKKNPNHNKQIILCVGCSVLSKPRVS